MKKITLYAFLFLMVPSVFAALNFTGSIVNFGSTLHHLLSDQYVVYAATFILWFIFLYSIFAAGLSKVSVFKSDSGYGSSSGINRQGKMVAVSLGLIGAIGNFYFFRSMEMAIKRVAGTAGFFAGVAFAGAIFAITYWNMKTTEPGKLHGGPAFFAAAMALIVYGMFADNQAATSWGTLILLITAIWAAIKAVGGIGKASPPGPTPPGPEPPGPVPPGPTPPGPTPPRPVPPTPPAATSWYPQVQGVDRSSGRLQGIIREV